jgi:hypothetical protein
VTSRRRRCARSWWIFRPRTWQRFKNTLVRASNAIYTWNHLTAGELFLEEGMSDDMFTDFRSWVVSLGRATYERILAAPDALADLHGVDDECLLAELFGAAPSEVYQLQTGCPLWEVAEILEFSHPPSGDPADLDQPAVQRRLFPRLTHLRNQ